MSKISVKQGQKVKVGQKLGEVGNTGNSTGPHLHLQVNNKAGNAMDPVKFMGIKHKKLDKISPGQ